MIDVNPEIKEFAADWRKMAAVDKEKIGRSELFTFNESSIRLLNGLKLGDSSQKCKSGIIKLEREDWEYGREANGFPKEVPYSELYYWLVTDRYSAQSELFETQKHRRPEGQFAYFTLHGIGSINSLLLRQPLSYIRYDVPGYPEGYIPAQDIELTDGQARAYIQRILNVIDPQDSTMYHPVSVSGLRWRPLDDGKPIFPYFRDLTQN